MVFHVAESILKVIIYEVYLCFGLKRNHHHRMMAEQNQKMVDGCKISGRQVVKSYSQWL